MCTAASQENIAKKLNDLEDHIRNLRETQITMTSITKEQTDILNLKMEEIAALSQEMRQHSVKCQTVDTKFDEIKSMFAEMKEMISSLTCPSCRKSLDPSHRTQQSSFDTNTTSQHDSTNPDLLLGACGGFGSMEHNSSEPNEEKEVISSESSEPLSNENETETSDVEQVLNKKKRKGMKRKRNPVVPKVLDQRRAMNSTDLMTFTNSKEMLTLKGHSIATQYSSDAVQTFNDNGTWKFQCSSKNPQDSTSLNWSSLVKATKRDDVGINSAPLLLPRELIEICGHFKLTCNASKRIDFWFLCYSDFDRNIERKDQLPRGFFVELLIKNKDGNYNDPILCPIVLNDLYTKAVPVEERCIIPIADNIDCNNFPDMMITLKL